MATAKPVMAPQMPKATPLSLPRKAPANKASETENIMAPPMPCTARETCNIRVLPAKPQVREDAVNTTTPMR